VRTYAHDWSFAHDAITQRIVSTISQRKKTSQIERDGTTRKGKDAAVLLSIHFYFVKNKNNRKNSERKSQSRNRG